MGLPQLYMFLLIQFGDQLEMSESDVCRHHGNLPSNIDHRTVRVNPYPADHDYCCFYSVLLVNQITVIGKEMCV